jgi:hypothetical protein
MKLAMFSDEALTWRFPFTGLPDGVVPDVSVNGGTWVPLTLDATYGDDLDDADPDKDADWYRVTFVGVGTDDTGMPVPTRWSRVVFRVQSGGLTDIKPDPDQSTIWLAVTAR